MSDFYMGVICKNGLVMYNDFVFRLWKLKLIEKVWFGVVL